MENLLPLIPIIIIIPLLIFWARMFRDMLDNDTIVGDNRLIWTLILTFFNVFGAALYYTTQYRKRY